jgi:hypothetical protein
VSELSKAMERQGLDMKVSALVIHHIYFSLPQNNAILIFVCPDATR